MPNMERAAAHFPSAAATGGLAMGCLATRLPLADSTSCTCTHMCNSHMHVYTYMSSHTLAHYAPRKVLTHMPIHTHLFTSTQI